MRRRRAGGMALVALGFAAQATGQHRHHDDDEAQRWFRHAVALTDEGRYAAAMTEFQRVYALTHNAALLFNVSATYEAMGEFAEALATLERFEAEAAPALRDARREELTAARARLTARTGTIVVTVSHPGLAVTVDGVERPIDALRAGLRVTVGPRRVGMSAPGFSPRERVVPVPGDARVVLDDPLTPTRSSVSVRCDVRGAEVRVDGVAVAVTPVTSPIDVTEGRHRVEVRRPGYRAYTVDVDARGLGASVDAELPWDPAPDAREAARIAVRVDERDAVAALDGRVIPTDGVAVVPPGAHELTVSREHFTTHTRAVTLAPGEVTRVRVALSPTAAYRDEYLSDARRQRAVGLAVTLGGLAVTIAGAVTAGVVWTQRNDNLDAMDVLSEQYRPTTRGACPRDDCAAVRSEYERRSSLLDVQGFGIGIGLAFAGAGLVTAGYGVWSLQRAPSMERFRVGVAPRAVSLGWSF